MRLISASRKNIFVLLLITFFCLLVGSLSSCRFYPEDTKDTPTEKIVIPELENINTSQVPQKAIDIANYVEQNHKAPKGFVGGRVFENREGLLPKKDNTGQYINYHEYDVNLKVKGQNRGAERIVIGDDESRYYTHDHYKSFTKF